MLEIRRIEEKKGSAVWSDEKMHASSMEATPTEVTTGNALGLINWLVNLQIKIFL